ncbi:PLP-dependent transferase [Spiroplasma diminutum]|uniref:L-seryl-tRNA selenocysteine synthase n=1 Tax=Spiroplasma diminutum CUAS-1 TaxID=1276221 RepID=S5MEN2_9MOLU|nr:PLP-dependent transferase [Spiroplasma diminutum]AGR42208.1 L-seryl-tRNA selenocysteine synthase [Spiroplasma diminutum CUAS-1]
MKNNFRKVINADGRMSILGVSRISDDVADAIKYAGNNFFVMSEFKEEVNLKIKKIINSENVCVVNSASAGISLAAAATIYKDRVYDVNKIVPNNNEIIIAKGQNIDFGAPIEILLNLIGAKTIEAGYSNMCKKEDYEYQINSNTAAILYVVSHHCVQKNMASLQEVIDLSKKNKIPLIVDCAAEEDIKKYSSMDIDVVIFSGSKAVEGPTSGLVFGKNELIINNIKLHSNIIGRVMKIGKENIYGLLKALENYIPKKVINFNSYLDIFNNNSKIVCWKDIDDRNIERIRFEIKDSIISARELSERLKKNDVAIYLRDYFSLQGFLDIDLRNISLEEAKIINQEIIRILGE